MRRNIFSIISLIIISSNSCKKDNSEINQVIEPEVINIDGEIILPEGSTIDPNSLQVYDINGVSDIINNKYNVKTYNNFFSTQLLLDSTNKVIMLGYNYPNDTNFNISLESTVLAMIMNCPPITELSDAGKNEMINKTLVSPELPVFKSIVENSILSGYDLFDTTNVELMDGLNNLFSSVTMKETGISSYSVNIYNSGRNLTFINDSKSIKSVIGIYSSGVRKKKIVIEGIDFIATSVSEIINGYSATADPIETNYTLEGDDEFEIIIRTGLPGNNDGTQEYVEAFNENITLAISKILKIYLELDDNCLNSIYNLVEGVSSIHYNDNCLTAIYTITAEVFKSISDCINLDDVTSATTFLNTVSGWFNLIDKTFSLAGNSENLMILTYDWVNTSCEFDTCYSAFGSSVTQCLDCGENPMDADGNIYDIIKIGTQCWMAENLKTTHYNDGTIIPSGLSSDDWTNTVNGAYTIYNNDPINNSIYGKLYNWYTVVDLRNICPEGWHIPSVSDWEQLIDYLGGAEVAGGNLKSITLWNTPNVGATNTSGFTALPSGVITTYGDFGLLGASTDFWTTNDYASYYAYHYWLSNESANIYQSWSDKNFGFSCRCVKNE